MAIVNPWTVSVGEKNDCSTESKLCMHILPTVVTVVILQWIESWSVRLGMHNLSVKLQVLPTRQKVKMMGGSKLHVDSIAIMMYQPGLGKVSGLHSKYRSEKYTITLSRSWLSPTGGGEGVGSVYMFFIHQCTWLHRYLWGWRKTGIDEEPCLELLPQTQRTWGTLLQQSCHVLT